MENDKIMYKEYEDDEITIDLGELLLVIWKKMYLVVIVTLLFSVLAYLGTKFLITPMYTSTTKLYVLAKQNDDSAVTYNELVTGTYLTQDYKELVTSRPVMEKVISNLNLDLTTSQLKSHISIETPEDTRILAISVEYPEAEMAKKIVDEVREAASVQIKEIMAVESVNTVEDGNLPIEPSSPSMLKNMIIGGFLGAVLMIGIILMKYILDDTIKTPEDVEKYLDITVLAAIPLQSNQKKSKKRRKKKSNKKMKR